jgi:malate synthase
MEDAATAEISRSQIWQWINAGVVFEGGEHSGTTVTADLAREVAAQELANIKAEIGAEAFAAGKWQQAHDLLLQVSLDADYADFLTLPAYEQLR